MAPRGLKGNPCRSQQSRRISRRMWGSVVSSSVLVTIPRELTVRHHYQPKHGPKDHNLILCHKVLDLHPFTTKKKGSTQQSTICDKVAITLNNNFSCLAFHIETQSVRNHAEILQNKHNKKLRELKKRPLPFYRMS